MIETAGDNRSVQWPWPLTGREQIDLQVLAVLIDGSANIPDFDVQAERSDQLVDPLLAATARGGSGGIPMDCVHAHVPALCGVSGHDSLHTDSAIS